MKAASCLRGAGLALVAVLCLAFTTVRAQPSGGQVDCSTLSFVNCLSSQGCIYDALNNTCGPAPSQAASPPSGGLFPSLTGNVANATSNLTGGLGNLTSGILGSNSSLPSLSNLTSGITEGAGNLTGGITGGLGNLTSGVGNLTGLGTGA